MYHKRNREQHSTLSPQGIINICTFVSQHPLNLIRLINGTRFDLSAPTWNTPASFPSSENSSIGLFAFLASSKLLMCWVRGSDLRIRPAGQKKNLAGQSGPIREMTSASRVMTRPDPVILKTSSPDLTRFARFQNLLTRSDPTRQISKEQWPKSGTPDGPIAVIGYPLNTVPQRLRTTSHWSKPHRTRTQPHVHRVHPIMAEQVLVPPDYGRTTRPPAHTHTRTRSGRELAPRHEAGHSLFFRLGALFPELFFVDHEVAVINSSPTHKAQKRTYADGLDIDHRLPGHGHGTRRANDSDAPFQMAQEDMFVAWRARETYCRHLSHHNTSDSRVHTKLATQRNMCTNIHETPHIT